MTQMDYFILVSTEDYIAAALTFVREKRVKQVKRPVGRSRKHANGTD